MESPAPIPLAPCAGMRRPGGPVRLGVGFGLRRGIVAAGWLLVPVLIGLGVRLHSPLHVLTALLLMAPLWPVTIRSGEVLWDGPSVSVRRYFRFVLLRPDQVEAAVVTPPLFHRQSLVLKLKQPLHLSRYVYCRLAPGTVCDAWALVHDRDWEPRGKS